MDEQEVIEIPADEIEIIDIEDYRGEVAEHRSFSSYRELPLNHCWLPSSGDE